MGNHTFYATIDEGLVKQLFPEGQVTMEDLRDVDEMREDAFVKLESMENMKFGCKDGKIVDIAAAPKPAEENPPHM